MLSQRSSKNRRAESLHLFPRKLVAIFSAGHETRAEKVSFPRRPLEWGIQEEVCCDWQNALKKRVFNKKLTLKTSV